MDVDETKQEPVGEPEAVDIEKELADAIDDQALFAAEIEPVRVEVPHWPGCYFILQKMDVAAEMKLQTLAMNMTLDADGKPIPSGLQVDKATEVLVCSTVVDFVLKRKSYEKGTTDVVWTEMVRPSSMTPRTRREKYVRDTLCGHPERDGERGIRPTVWKWLVYQCQRVNGMTADQGNASSAS